MSKTLIYTAPDRMIAESYAADLRDAGIPVKVEFTTGFGETHPLGPAELWVDNDVLAGPGIADKVMEVLAEEPLTDDDAAAISDLRFADLEPTTLPQTRQWVKRLALWLLALAAVIVYMALGIKLGITNGILLMAPLLTLVFAGIASYVNKRTLR